MPWTVFGKLELVPAQDPGPLAAKGEAVKTVYWPLSRHLFPLAPWFLWVLLCLTPENRRLRMWPLAAPLLVSWIILSLLPWTGMNDALVWREWDIMAQAYLLGLFSCWLLAPPLFRLAAWLAGLKYSMLARVALSLLPVFALAGQAIILGAPIVLCLPVALLWTARSLISLHKPGRVATRSAFFSWLAFSCACCLAELAACFSFRCDALALISGTEWPAPLILVGVSIWAMAMARKAAGSHFTRRRFGLWLLICTFVWPLLSAIALCVGSEWKGAMGMIELGLFLCVVHFGFLFTVWRFPQQRTLFSDIFDLRQTR